MQPVALISPDVVVVDGALQPRVLGLDIDHVRALEAVVETWPALKVVRRGER